MKGENVSYKIDYSVNSSSVGGSKSKGSIYIRGIKSESGFDSFKFVLEKNVDFAELDSQMIIGAVEHIFKTQPGQSEKDDSSSENKPRFQARRAAKNNNKGN